MTCPLCPRLLPRYFTHQLPQNLGDGLRFSVLLMSCTSGHSSAWGDRERRKRRTRRQGGGDQSAKGRRGRNPGPGHPAQLALLSGQLGPSPTAPSPLTSRPKALPGLLSVPDRAAKHQQSSRDLSHWAAAAGARAKSLQGLFEAQRRIEQTLCPGSLPVRKGRNTREEEQEGWGAACARGYGQGPGEQGWLSGSLPWAGSPAWPSSSPPAAAGQP